MHYAIEANNNVCQRLGKSHNPGTVAVTVLGDSLPVSWRGRFHIIFAILRQLHLCFCLLRLTWSGPSFEPPDIYVVDQLSTCIPILRWIARTRVIFYCHFPDLLLSPGRAGFDTGMHGQGGRSFLRMMYRWPVDLLEETSTGTCLRECCSFRAHSPAETSFWI